MLGVVKVDPVPKLEPPVASANQLMVPDEAVALRVTEPVPQPLAGVVPVIVGTIFTVAITAVLVPGEQPFSVAST